MLYYSLFGDKVSKVGVNTIYEALRRLESYPDFVSEILELTEYILSNLENKKDGFGNTCPFICFGLVDYISSKGDKPMKINWQMHQPILPKFLNAV